MQKIEETKIQLSAATKTEPEPKALPEEEEKVSEEIVPMTEKESSRILRAMDESDAR